MVAGRLCVFVVNSFYDKGHKETTNLRQFTVLRND
jgi:hypothetical protein